MKMRLAAPLAVAAICSSFAMAAEDVPAIDPAIQRLLSLLDLERPELAAVKKAQEAGDWEGAMDALATHYRSRFPRDGIKLKYVKEDAVMALDMKFRSRPSRKYFKLHEEFDWYRRPDEIPDHHWLNLLVSLHPLQFTADEYIASGDEKYARAVVAIFEDWLKHCPPGSGSPSWSLATTMIRSGVFLRTFERMIQWEGWPHASMARFLCNIYDHVDFMVERRGKGNQDATNSEHLMRLATGFPEFRDAGKWMEAGYGRVKERIFEDVLEDGTQRELTSGYHQAAMNTYTLAAKRMADFGRPVDDAFRERLEGMYQWCLVMARPDGSVPVNGDSVGGNVHSYLADGAKLFGRDDMKFVASRGKEGKAPAFLDGVLPVAGYYTMRTSWTDPDAVYLFLDGSRQPVVSHQDFDALHVDLFAYGRDFLPDKGTFTYGGEYHKAAKATKNHSTVTIDDRNQKDVPAVLHGRMAEKAFGFVDCSQQGSPEVTHRRQALLVRPDDVMAPYVVLVDRITGKGSRTADQYFHLPPGPLEQLADRPGVVTAFEKGANLRIEQVLADGIETELVETEMHPRQGATVNRPGVRFRREGPLPAMFVTLLYPYRGLDPEPLHVQLVGETTAGEPVVLEVKQGSAVDRITITADEEASKVTLDRKSVATDSASTR